MRIKDWFISSESNNYSPWIASPSALALFCLVIWLLRWLIPAQIGMAEGSIDAGDLMAKVNLERSQRFIPTLNTNSKLITAASGKASDMLARSYFAHVDPDGNYVWPRIQATGYTPYLTLGENLAMDFSSAQGVIDAWMNSPTHRANIVNEKFQDQGLSSIAGTYAPNHDTIMVVSLFGTLYQKPKAVAPAPAPTTPAPKTTKPKPVAQIPPKTSPPAPPPTTPIAKVLISNDAKIDVVSAASKQTVSVNIVVSGNPTLVTAQLKTQSITLLPGKVQGEYVGVFTFDAGEDLANQKVNIEARDKTGKKVTQAFTFKLPLKEEVSGESDEIPVSNEAEAIKILRIVFGIFAGLYFGFLLVDGIIVHRAKIKRDAAKPGSHLLLLFIVAAVTLFANWF